jgi:hypothetical protein
MSFHRALRAAVYARLIEAPALPAPAFSSPPANLRYPVIVIGQVVLEEKIDKTSRDGWYLVGVESATQGQSPAEMDAISDAVEQRLDGAELVSSTVDFSKPAIIAEDDDANPDAPGGPINVRLQRFRVFCGAK